MTAKIMIVERSSNRYSPPRRRFAAKPTFSFSLRPPAPLLLVLRLHQFYQFDSLTQSRHRLCNLDDVRRTVQVLALRGRRDSSSELLLLKILEVLVISSVKYYG